MVKGPVCLVYTRQGRRLLFLCAFVDLFRDDFVEEERRLTGVVGRIGRLRGLRGEEERLCAEEQKREEGEIDLVPQSVGW